MIIKVKFDIVLNNLQKYATISRNWDFPAVPKGKYDIFLGVGKETYKSYSYIDYDDMSLAPLEKEENSLVLPCTLRIKTNLLEDAKEVMDDLIGAFEFEVVTIYT